MPAKAILWPKENILLIADLHLGKINHFRKSGIPVPVDAEYENLDRLAYLLLNHKVDRVLVLGDLFHSTYNQVWRLFKTFLTRFETIQFDLIMGNHDILEESHYDASNLTIYKYSLSLGPFYFTHHPESSAGVYNICGHVHPSVHLRGTARQGIRLPCFYFSKHQAILSAFGAFTGNGKIKGNKSDHIFAIADGTIVKVL